MPIIFASSVLILPSALASFGSKTTFGKGHRSCNPFSQVLVSVIANALAPQELPGHHVYFYVVLIVFFSYFYSSLVVNPVDMAQNLKKMGASIPGIRPGVATSKYIEGILYSTYSTGGGVFRGCCYCTDRDRKCLERDHFPRFRSDFTLNFSKCGDRYC